MTEITTRGWPGVRETTRDGKFSFCINVANTVYTEHGFYDAESAAHALDATKYSFIASGHLKRSNFWLFPDIVRQWQLDEVVNPKPHSDLLKFMAFNTPRYAPLEQRNAEARLAKEEKAKRACAVKLPSRGKIFSAHVTLRALLAATPSPLNDEERTACTTVLASLAVLRDR